LGELQVDARSSPRLDQTLTGAATMQNTWHIIAFYSHMAAEVMSGRVHYAKLPKFTRAHDAYLKEHDKSVSAFVAAQPSR